VARHSEHNGERQGIPGCAGDWEGEGAVMVSGSRKVAAE
jgi:hypothetical protein